MEKMCRLPCGHFGSLILVFLSFFFFPPKAFLTLITQWELITKLHFIFKSFWNFYEVMPSYLMNLFRFPQHSLRFALWPESQHKCQRKNTLIFGFLSMPRDKVLEGILKLQVGILNSSHSVATQNYIVLLTTLDIRLHIMKRTKIYGHCDWIIFNCRVLKSLSCFL